MAAGHVSKPAPLMRHAPLSAVAEMFVAIFEGELGDAGFIEVAEAFGDYVVVLFLCGAADRGRGCALAQVLSRCPWRRARRGKKSAVLSVLPVFGIGFEHARVRAGLPKNFSQHR